LLAAEGLSVKAIAFKLHKAFSTVRHQLGTARGHMGAVSTTHAVAMAMRLKLIV